MNRLNIKSSSKYSKEDFEELVLYHGTSSDFESFDEGNGIYFTSCPEEASQFATGAFYGEDAFILENSRVIPVRLSFKNPFIITYADEAIYEEYVMSGFSSEMYISEGYDGVIYVADGHKGGDYFIVFSNKQITYELQTPQDNSLEFTNINECIYEDDLRVA